MDKLSTNYSWGLNGKRNVMKMRKLISIIISLTFTILLIPQLALPTSAVSSATTIDVSDSSPAALPAGVTYSSGVYTIGSGANNTSITVTGATSVNTIYVSGGVTGLTLNLDGVSITSSTASPIALSSAVTLHLNDGTASELAEYIGCDRTNSI